MNLISDIRYTLRLLRKSPNFTALSLLIIVLGLTLQLVSYSFTKVLHDLPMPFPDGDRYIVFKQTEPETGLDAFFPFYDEYQYNQIRSNVSSYDVLGAMFDVDMVVSDRDYAQTVKGVTIEPQLLAATAVRPLMGRLFTREDMNGANNHVAVISENLWRGYYAGDPNIIGKSSRIDGLDYTIIGVMPKSFHYPSTDNLWLPFDVSAAASPGHAKPLAIVGILKEGVSKAQATAELEPIMRRLQQEKDYVGDDAFSPPLVDDFAAQLVAKKFNIHIVLLVLTSVILALVALNLGTLLFLRTQRRWQEMAVRASLGANMWQNMKAVLLESLLLCLVGLILSLLLSQSVLFALDKLLVEGNPDSPFWYDFTLRVDACALGLLSTFVVWLLASVTVAYRAAKHDPATVLSSTNTGGDTNNKSALMTRAIVGLEVALSCFLLVLCLVVVNIVINFFRDDVGTPVEGYYAGTVRLTGPNYQTNDARMEFLRALKQKAQAIPDISALSFATLLPTEGLAWEGGFELPDRDLGEYTRHLSVWVDADYFSTMNIKLLEGRQFDASDTEDSLPVAMVNKQFVDKYWPGESALGKTVTLDYENSRKTATVVGVIATINQANLVKNLVSPFYLPLTQGAPDTFQLAIKGANNVDKATVEQRLKDVLTQVDRDIALRNFGTLEDRVIASLNGFETVVQPFAFIALVALIFACIGVYGVIARTIALKTRAIGVRRALGSSNQKIIALFIKQGFTYLLTGVLVGCGGAVLLATLVASVLASLEPDMMNIVVTMVIAVTAIMALLIFISSYLPARRSVGIEPGDALRYE